MKPILQVALDLEELVKAVEIATKISSTFKCENVWLEIGTPLLKSWGKIAVRSIKELTKCFVVADTKTMDVPLLEARVVRSAGADAFTVLGVADDETLMEAITAKREIGALLIVDLISCKDPYKRALEVAKYEPDVILFHVGISVQRARGVTAMQLVEEAVKVKEEIGVKVAVAGGLKPGTIRPIVERGVDIIIVGAAITSAKDPVEVTRTILIEMGFI
ncbi:MAG: orotidine 5'-phosphate decarboxylase [Desulfurococcaceae archaeon]|nr:orotidine 5'-phosphate decarboxylase [Desulfurococcaceae archaeon]